MLFISLAQCICMDSIPPPCTIQTSSGRQKDIDGSVNAMSVIPRAHFFRRISDKTFFKLPCRLAARVSRPAPCLNCIGTGGLNNSRVA